MPMEISTTIKDMNIDIPANSEPRVQGAGQIRAVKRIVKTAFPNVDFPVTATSTRMNDVLAAGMPAVGMIMMFQGATAPDGWAFCDGGIYNSVLTPDLRGMFIMGANLEYDPERPITEDLTKGEVAVGATGGSNYEKDFGSTLAVAPHALSMEEMPRHNHTLGWGPANKGKSSGGSYRVNYSVKSETSFTGGQEDETTKAHEHKLVHKPVDSADPEVLKEYDKRPLWYALSYIMFVGIEAEA